jgi:radical SAM superfamily enzyme YgiQ (UPF0313 family)
LWYGFCVKILLVHPYSRIPWIDKTHLIEPLALEYLASGLEPLGHEVRIVDQRLERDFEAIFREMAPDVVGYTGYTSHVNVVKETATRFKELKPEVFNIVGGHHATVVPKDFNIPAVDLVVRGEGVFTLREVIAALEKKQPFEAIPGLAIPGDPMKLTAKRPHSPLDDLPFPVRHHNARFQNDYYLESFKPCVTMRTSVGCTSRCNFCACWMIMDGKYRARRPETVVAELETIDEEQVYFVDDEAFADTKRAWELVERIKAAGIGKRYALYTRVKTVTDHPDLLAAWREAGLAVVQVGMEAHSDERLARMAKPSSIRKQREAVAILRDLGIFLYASFMVEPDYTKDDFKAMADYVRHDLKLPYASFTMMTPFPGTRVHEEIGHTITTRNPELHDICHMVLPTRMSLREFYAEFADLYINALSPGVADGSNEFLQNCRNGYKLHEPLEGAPR